MELLSPSEMSCVEVIMIDGGQLRTVISVVFEQQFVVLEMLDLAANDLFEEAKSFLFAMMMRCLLLAVLMSDFLS